MLRIVCEHKTLNTYIDVSRNNLHDPAEIILWRIKILLCIFDFLTSILYCNRCGCRILVKAGARRIARRRRWFDAIDLLKFLFELADTTPKQVCKRAIEMSDSRSSMAV